MGSVGPALLPPFLSESCVGRDFGVVKNWRRECVFVSFFLSFWDINLIFMLPFLISLSDVKIIWYSLFFINQMILHSEKNSIWHIGCVTVNEGVAFSDWKFENRLISMRKL